jgi:formamidase
MEQHGARLVFPIDVKKKPWEQKLPLHNRWHPDIPPVAEVTVRELFRVEMVDFSGGRITKEYSAEDIKNADPSIVSCSYLPYCLCVPVKLALISFLFQYLLHGSITIYIYA